MSDSNKDKAATLVIKKLRGSDEFQDVKTMNQKMTEHEPPVDSTKVGLAAAFEEIQEAMRSGDRLKGIEAMKSFIQMVVDGMQDPQSRS